MTVIADMFRTCACCPSPCRSAIPAGDVSQTQSATPSSLAMVALAIADGHLELDAAALGFLRRTSQARHCVSACPYGYDVASAIIEFVEERTRTDDPSGPAR